MQAQKSTVVQINAKEFPNQFEKIKNLQLVDVRTQKEYEEGHLKNAKNINWFST
jgi:rhodanese-related sulfurtransferase